MSSEERFGALQIPVTDRADAYNTGITLILR